MGAATQADSAIPIAVIAGGIVAGSLLAVVICLAWMHWGKLLERARLYHWKEVEAGHRTKLNRIQEIGRKPHILSYQSVFARPMDRKVKFVGGDKTGSDKTMASRSESGLAFTLAHVKATPPLAEVPEVSKPRPLRSAKGSSHLSSPSGLKGTFHISGNVTTSPPRIPHKPSTVSSLSMYSAASGEEHQVRVPPNLILAATGELSTSWGGERRSVASSSWSFLSRMAHGVQENMYRHSQASNRSAYTVPSRDSSGAPIGMAL